MLGQLRLVEIGPPSLGQQASLTDVSPGSQQAADLVGEFGHPPAGFHLPSHQHPQVLGTLVRDVDALDLPSIQHLCHPQGISPVSLGAAVGATVPQLGRIGHRQPVEQRPQLPVHRPRIGASLHHAVEWAGQRTHGSSHRLSLVGDPLQFHHLSGMGVESHHGRPLGMHIQSDV